MSKFSRYASVVLDLALDRPLDYGITADQLDIVKPGVPVEVPVRGRMRKGYVHQLADESEFKRVLPINKVLSEAALVTPELFELALWIARYYLSPLSKVLKTILPAAIRKDVGHRQQLFVKRKKSRDELADIARKLRGSNDAQANVLDVMLNVTKGIFLSELLEQADVSRSPIESLVKKGLLEVDNIQVERKPLAEAEYFPTRAKNLLPEQSTALDKITDALNASRYETHLLFGVTGSGKTEVYLQAIDHALNLGKGTIMLVPEIALTAQTIQRFRARFQQKIAILHSGLGAGERYDEWQRIHRGEANIVIGARSAIFSPVHNLGLIIVDEEHENTYKQGDEMPCYHARDVAVMRGHLSKSTVVLGSATPSLESYANAKQGKYILSELTYRPNDAQIPTVTVVDMRREFEKAKGFTTFSDRLLTEIDKRHQKGEQCILFLNRRGYHTSLMCQECQKAVGCPHCDVSLTFHRGNHDLACHLCGFRISPPPKQCPSCNSTDTMKFRGVGTEQVERALHAIFPEIRTIRMDADTTRHKGSHDKLLSAFKSGKADVLIGTQMIAKGLHFPEVTLVGVLNTDATLNIPDFRSSEWAFQLITQVAGRAGRGALPGEVIIQTAMPDNVTIAQASDQDYVTFADSEIEVREAFGYPPFGHFTKITISSKNESQGFTYGEQLRQALVAKLDNTHEIYPVQPAGHAKVKDYFRFQLLIRTQRIYIVNQALEAIKAKQPVPSGVRILINVDPTSTFF